MLTASLKPAVLSPRKNYWMNDLSKLTIRNGTPSYGVVPEKDMIYFTASGLYAGINLTYGLQALAGKQVTFSYLKKVGLGSLTMYWDINGASQSYIGIDQSVMENGSRTVSIPYNATNIRIYVQNVSDTGYYEFYGIQLEIGTAKTAHERYALRPKLAKTVPQYNLVPPYTDSRWQLGSIATVLSGDSLRSIQPTGASNASQQTKIRLLVKPNTTYTALILGMDNPEARMYISTGPNGWDTSITGLSISGYTKATFSTGLNNAIYLVLHNRVAGTFNYGAIMLVEGTGDAFVPYQEGMKKSTTLKTTKGRIKQPVYNLPFTFQRVGKLYNGITEVAQHQPRVAKGGIVIEENTVNMAIGVNLGSNQATRTDMGDYHRIAAIGTGNFKGMFIGRISGVQSSKQYAFKAKIKKGPGDGYIQVRAEMFNASGTMISSQFLGNYDFTKDYNEFTFFTTGTTVQVTITLYMQNAVDGEYYDLYKDYQFEESAYATTYVEGTRNKEIFSLMNGEQYIDSEAGSIEIELETLEGNTFADTSGYGFHDLVYYTTGTGFILRRNYNGLNKIELITTNQSGGTISNAPTYIWQNGETIKYKLEWNRTAGYFRLYLNGELFITHSTVFKMPANGYPIQLGSRGLLTEIYRAGNAIYKKFVIRDRNNVVKFEL